jgi:2-polyprenyl-3-methyl-5-hydroxy-6-metoxy-1,4-benzoquinol methylase
MVEQQARKHRGDLLDIGCGDGDFLRAMRRRGWNTTGVELVDEKRSKLGARGIRAIGPEGWPGLDSASFNAVTLWHALEHLHKPLDVLRHVRRLLKPEGICVIAVPNAASPQARRDGSRWFGYDVPRHLWHFTPVTLARLLAQTGFAVREFRATRIDGFTITLLMMHIQGRKDWPRAIIESCLQDVLLARTAEDASCMMCIAS